jgi:Tfp pilus assembly PilM family ATPase
MVVVSTRELTQNKNRYFDMAHRERVVIKRKNRFFQLFDLGESMPEVDDTYMTREELYAKIDRGMEEYRQGKTKVLDVANIDSFLGI